MELEHFFPNIGLVFHPFEHRVFYEKKNIFLTSVQSMILDHLMKHHGKLVSKEDLYKVVWEERIEPDYPKLFVHVFNLRKRLGVLQKHIVTSGYDGYIFDTFKA